MRHKSDLVSILTKMHALQAKHESEVAALKEEMLLVNRRRDDQNTQLQARLEAEHLAAIKVCVFTQSSLTQYMNYTSIGRTSIYSDFCYCIAC